MNSNFNDEQIRAYAEAFEEGDAIWCSGLDEWKELVANERFGTVVTTTRSGDNGYVVNFTEENEREPVTEGFDKRWAQYRVTTLDHYELQGGEKLVWLGGSGSILTFGKTYSAFNDSNGNVLFYNDNDVSLQPRKKSSLWAVIPRYKRVKRSIKPKFKVGDIVTVKTYKAPATVKEVEESKTTETYIYNVEYNGDKSMKFWESDLELYEEEKTESRPASSHYHDDNNGNDVWQFADDNLSDERVKGFHQINAIKYVSRYHKKHDTTEKRIEDLEKAKVSIDKLIELEKKG